MKKVLLPLIVAFGVFFISPVALAQGFIEYDLLSINGDFAANQSMGLLYLGGEHSIAPFTIGVTYAVPLNWTPPLDPGNAMALVFWGIYAGQDLFQSKIFDLIVVGGYYKWDWTLISANTEEALATSIALGLKNRIKFGPVNISLIYLYGVQNTFARYTNSIEQPTNNNPGFSLLELRAAYRLNEMTGIYLSYLALDIKDGGADWGQGGIGIGLQGTF